MIVGVAKAYFMAIGSTQEIEYSDHYKFLEDERTYLTKQYANGKPKDNDSFNVFDITNLDTTLNVGLKAANQATSFGAVALSSNQMQQFSEMIAQAIAQGVALAVAQAQQTQTINATDEEAPKTPRKK